MLIVESTKARLTSSGTWTSARLFTLGLVLGVIGAAAVMAVDASASPLQSAARAPVKHSAPAESGQPVIDWNQILIGLVNTPGVQPATIQPTRNFAILHAAIYDAVNSIDRTHTPYLVSIRAPRAASATAAADAAAHAVLAALYPAQQPTINDDYTSELAQVANGKAKDEGVRVGNAAAAALLADRADDGSRSHRHRLTPARPPATTARRRRTSLHQRSRPGARCNRSFSTAPTSSAHQRRQR